MTTQVFCHSHTHSYSASIIQFFSIVGNLGFSILPQCFLDVYPFSVSMFSRGVGITVGFLYLIEARWRMATSRAWTESRGTCRRPLTRVSCSRRHETLASQRMDTLKIRSLPSPGMVTSKSTWRDRGKWWRTKTSGEQEHRSNRKHLAVWFNVIITQKGISLITFYKTAAFGLVTCSWHYNNP